MMQLEGFEYDVTADVLTAKVASRPQAGKPAERAVVEVPIVYGLRKAIDAALTIVSHVLGVRTIPTGTDWVTRPGPARRTWDDVVTARAADDDAISEQQGTL